MSRNLISIPSGKTTMQILRRELDRIEAATGYRPEDWLWDMYDEAYEEFMNDNWFDWDGFEMHIDCLADSFIEFIEAHYHDLNMNL